MKLKPLRDQVVVVTGASSGIGLATARKAAAAGAKVLLVARGETALKGAVDDIMAAGGTAAHAVADVGEIAQLEQAAARAEQLWGRIDTWISNAGVAIYSDLLTTPRDEHERLFRTNYWGAVNSAQVAVSRLARFGGALIVVGSVASDMGTPVMGAYAASKHAVKGYVDSLRLELNRDKIPVSLTLIKPSGIDTPLPEHVANHGVGAAKIPPPLYSPELAADVILRAAVKPSLELVVGGAGQAQLVFASHFPGWFAKVAGALTPVLNDPTKPQPDAANLFRPTTGGRANGDGKGVMSFSLYSAAQNHSLASVAALLAGLAVVGLAAALARLERNVVED